MTIDVPGEKGYNSRQYGAWKRIFCGRMPEVFLNKWHQLIRRKRQWKKQWKTDWQSQDCALRWQQGCWPDAVEIQARRSLHWTDRKQNMQWQISCFVIARHRCRHFTELILEIICGHSTAIPQRARWWIPSNRCWSSNSIRTSIMWAWQTMTKRRSMKLHSSLWMTTTRQPWNPWVRQKNVWHVFWNCTRSAIKCQMRSLQMLIPT